MAEARGPREDAGLSPARGSLDWDSLRTLASALVELALQVLADKREETESEEEVA